VTLEETRRELLGFLFLLATWEGVLPVGLGGVGLLGPRLRPLAAHSKGLCCINLTGQPLHNLLQGAAAVLIFKVSVRYCAREYPPPRAHLNLSDASGREFVPFYSIDGSFRFGEELLGCLASSHTTRRHSCSSFCEVLEKTAGDGARTRTAVIRHRILRPSWERNKK
jgi:hypothetical protein